MTKTDRIARIPTRPGVYLLRDANGKVIYVGKARNLRSRLRTYLGKGEPPNAKVAILRERLAGFETIIAGSETEALVLEANLIKEHRPRYNVKLKDDKRYPFIKVTLSEDYPRAYVTRILREDGSRYFGPYTDAKAMRRTLRLIRKLFPIRTCPTFKLRPRPCLNYQIGRCLGPCRGTLPKSEYGAVIDQLCLFLDGRADEVKRLLEEEMAAASLERRYEDAAVLRDRIADIARIADRQRVITAERVERDVVAVASHESYGAASVLRIRAGKLVGCENCPLSLGTGSDHAEALAAFVKQFYGISPDLPDEILIDREIGDREAIESWLSERRGARVRVAAPKRGAKRRLVEFAEENARHALRTAFEERRAPKVVLDLAEALSLSKPPRLIAGVDISNVGGSHAVGTVVVFRDGRRDRGLYRKYRIRTVKGSDDYAMIREVVSRHFAQLIREGLELPDLLLVDGGKGQLSAAMAALRETGVRGLAVAALAKREEEIFVPGRAKPVPLDPSSQAKRLLVRVRDEVHRFSIEYHRNLRTREARTSALDGVPGVGPTRKEALLRAFGSVAAIADRSPEELAEVPGIGIGTARKIKEALEGGPSQAGDRAAG